jgi:putative DNA primase/helicase
VTIRGELCSAAVIYDAPDVPQRKKFMPRVRTINGAAVQLFEPLDVLAVTEGIENALAVHQMFGHPAWAALSDTGLATFEPPPVRELLIYGDNDKSFAGQAAAYTLAKRLRNAKTIEAIEVRLPPAAGVDWLDVLNG